MRNNKNAFFGETIPKTFGFEAATRRRSRQKMRKNKKMHFFKTLVAEAGRNIRNSILFLCQPSRVKYPVSTALQLDVLP